MDRSNTRPPNPGMLGEFDVSTAPAFHWQNSPLLRRDVLGASLGVNLFSLALPMVVLQVYDRIIPNQATSTLLLLVLGMLVVLVLDSILKTARAYLAGWIGARFEHRVGMESVEKILRADPRAVEAEAPGRHLDRLAGVDLVRDFYSSQASIAIIDLPFVALFLGLFFYIAGSLVLLPLFLLVVFSLSAAALGRNLHKALSERSVWDDRRYSFIIETLGGIHTIKSMAMERLIERRYERLMQSCSTAGMKTVYFSGLAQSLGSSFSQITMVSVVAVGSLYVMDGRLSIGGLAACTLLAGRAVQPVLRALGLWTRFQSIQVAEEKLAELDKYAPRLSAEAVDPEPFTQLQFERVSFRFGGEGRHLLQDMSLSVSPGEIIGIRGKNGSGKSTLLRLMMGALEPSLGRVLINGQDIAKTGSEKWRRDIAYLAQRPVLFDGSVMENITMFCDDQTDEALAIAKTLGLDKVFARYPEGFDTQIGARAVSNLPGGVGQRVAAARALLRRPKLILFDEANAAMDNTGDNLLRETLLRHQAEAAIVLISYRPSLLAIATSRFDLEEGRLVPVAVGGAGKVEVAAQGSPGQGAAS